MNFKFQLISTPGWEQGVKTGSGEEGECLQRSMHAFLNKLYCCQFEKNLFFILGFKISCWMISPHLSLLFLHLIGIKTKPASWGISKFCHLQLPGLFHLPELHLEPERRPEPDFSLAVNRFTRRTMRMRHTEPCWGMLGPTVMIVISTLKPTKSAQIVLRWKGMTGVRDCLAQGIF